MMAQIHEHEYKHTYTNWMIDTSFYPAHNSVRTRSDLCVERSAPKLALEQSPNAAFVE